MSLILSFPMVDPLHEYVAHGYVVRMSGWIRNKPDSSHSYFRSTPFLICSSNAGTAWFRFATLTLMFCQYWERKSWPWTHEVEGVATRGPLVRDQCMVVPSHVGYLDITWVTVTESVTYLTCQRKLCPFSVLSCLSPGFPMSSIRLSLFWILLIIWNTSVSTAFYSYFLTHLRSLFSH